MLVSDRSSDVGSSDLFFASVAGQEDVLAGQNGGRFRALLDVVQTLNECNRVSSCGCNQSTLFDADRGRLGFKGQAENGDRREGFVDIAG